MPAAADPAIELPVNPRRPPKNVWDAVFMPFGIVGAWLLLSSPIFYLRRIGMPPDAFMLSPAKEISFLVFVLGAGVASIGPGLLLSNLALWAVPAIRRQQDKLCHGRGKEVFKQANRGLFGFSLAMFVVLYPLAFASGLEFFVLAPDGVHYRHLLSASPKLYPWSDVQKINSKCYTARSPNAKYEMVFSDGRSIDLAAYSERNFFAAYPKLSASLQQAPRLKFYFDAQASVSCPSSWMPYFATRPGR